MTRHAPMLDSLGCLGLLGLCLSLGACKGEPAPDATPAVSAPGDIVATTPEAVAQVPTEPQPGAPEPNALAETPEAETPEAETPEAETPESGVAELVVERFWVAGDGLRAYDLDGHEVATLTKIGDRARRLVDGRIAVIAQASPSDALIVLSPDGNRLTEVTLPNDVDLTACIGRSATDGEGIGLSIQSADDFGINAKGTHACIKLLDRNVNMADYLLDVSVELSSAKLDSQVALDIEEACPRRDALAVCAASSKAHLWIEPAVATAPPSSAASANWPFAYEAKTGQLRKGSELVVELCPPADQRFEEFDPKWGCAQVELESSSGRWTVLSGAVSEGDYMHRDIFVLDRKTGSLQTIDCDDDTCRLRAVEPSTLYVGIEAFSVVGESELHALPRDRLWIDGKLLILERGEIVSIGGELAQSL